jgi:hypothetical protein
MLDDHQPDEDRPSRPFCLGLFGPSRKEPGRVAGDTARLVRYTQPAAAIAMHGAMTVTALPALACSPKTSSDGRVMAHIPSGAWAISRGTDRRSARTAVRRVLRDVIVGYLEPIAREALDALGLPERKRTFHPQGRQVQLRRDRRTTRRELSDG